VDASVPVSSVPAGADVVDVDARPVADIAQIDDLLVIRREARGQHGRLAVGQEAVVGPVRIHDRKPLDAPVLGSALGDIGNAAVEEWAFARKARIDGVRAFVRRASPVPRRDDIAGASELGLERDVVEIAADGELAVRIGADETLDERRGTGAAPMVEGRRRHFRKGHGAHAARPDWAEKAAARQISRDDLGHLPAEHVGRTGHRSHALGSRHHRDCDHHVLRAGVGYVDAERRILRRPGRLRRLCLLRQGGACPESEGHGGDERKSSLHCESLLSNEGLITFQAS
jgi:hypothetical protein